MRLSRLKLQAALLGLLPAMVLMAVLVGFLVNSRVTELETSFEEQGQAIAREFASLSVLALFTDDREQLYQIARAILMRDDVTAVAIYNSEGRIVVEMDQPTRHTAEPNARLLDFHAGVVLDPTDTPLFDFPEVAHPHDLEGSTQPNLGVVHVQLTDARVVRSGRETIKQALTIALPGLLLTTLIAIGLSRRVTNPIERLIGAVRSMSEGDLDSRVPETSRGELRALEEGFNRMVERLEVSQTDLQKQIDQATEELLETMEQLEIRNVELDLARKRALEASRVKSEFLANMSHEIRTPMNGVIGFANLLANTELEERQREYVSTIAKSAASLLGIINDILDFSKLESGHLTLERTSFRLRTCLEDSLALLAPQAHDNGLELVMLIYDDVPDHLIGDPNRIRQLLVNLVGNAIKFTERGEVIVRVMLEGQHDGRHEIQIVVSDTGVGIGPELMQRLFEPFSQGSDPSAVKNAGTGLGLSICKKLAQAMGGRIWAESQPGAGATFTVSLTLPALAPESPPGAPELIGRRVLLYDSHRLSSLALLHRLDLWQLDVHRCGKIDALDAALASTDPAPDAVLLGFGHEELANGTAETTVRRCAEAAKGPVIALASSSDEAVLGRLRRAGAAKGLSKPVTGLALTQALRSALKLSRTFALTTDGGQSATEGPDLSGWSILLADDNEINRRLVEELLARTGARTVAAVNGKQVLDAVAAERFDLLLLDVHMPVMDGLEATRWIRAREQGARHTPIIGLTADALPENRKRMFSAGMDECLIKPLEPPRLWQLIEQIRAGGLNPAQAVAAETDAQGDPGLAVRDTERATRIAGGNPGLARQIFAAMREDLEVQMDELYRLHGAGSWIELANTAHRLRGSAAYCATLALNAALQRLEESARSHDLKTLRRALASCGVEAERVLRYAESETETDSGRSG